MENPINLHNLLVSNSKLVREKKELIHLVRLLNTTLNQMSDVADSYSKQVSDDAEKYKTLPKGFLINLLKNRSSFEQVMAKTKETSKIVEKSVSEVSGDIDDRVMGGAYFDSLIEEMNRIKNNSIKNNYMNQMWFEGYMGSDGNWKFKKVDKNNPKYNNDIFGNNLQDYLSDQINKLFNDMNNDMNNDSDDYNIPPEENV